MTGLTTISLPDSISYVGPDVFHESNLSVLVLGPNVAFFHESALGTTTKVSEIHIRSRPEATQTSICEALNYSHILDKVRIFVGGGSEGKICDISVEVDPTMTMAPTVIPTLTESSVPSVSLHPTATEAITATHAQTSVITKSSVRTPEATDAKSKGHDKKLVVGLSVGLVALVLIAIVGVLVFCRRRRRGREDSGTARESLIDKPGFDKARPVVL
jgi:hypothetical protein